MSLKIKRQCAELSLAFSDVHGSSVRLDLKRPEFVPFVKELGGTYQIQ